MQLKFGPSAWFANTHESFWVTKVSKPNYANLFITWNQEVRQSAVTLAEVVDGIPEDDFRLRDEILDFIKSSQ